MTIQSDEVTMDTKLSEPKNNVEGIYRLAPMQQGMMFHTLFAPGSGTYFQQYCFSLRGSVEVAIFEQAWQLLVDRHTIFRTSFKWERNTEPIQIVLKKVKAPVTYLDWEADGPPEQNARREQLLEEDRATDFNFSKPPLMRLALIRRGEDSYWFIWSYHHLLMDGWCTQVIIEEFFEIYRALKTNQPLSLEPVQPYSRFIEWLQSQNVGEARDYWNRYLIDYKQPAVLPGKRMTQSGEYRPETATFTLEEDRAGQLKNIAKLNQTTLNTVFQTIWGILLQKYNHTHDVVFGAVVSGRPPEIIGIERMIGLFINTVPVRIKTEPGQTFQQLLKQTQRNLVECQKYNYVLLAEIQATALLKQQLFTHIFVFENYPIELNSPSSNPANTGLWAITDCQIFEKTNYDFNLVIIPGAQVKIIINFNAAIYDRQWIGDLERQLKSIIQVIIDQETIPIEQIEILSAPESQPQEKTDLRTKIDFDF